jgi:hypothetical protein
MIRRGEDGGVEDRMWHDMAQQRYHGLTANKSTLGGHRHELLECDKRLVLALDACHDPNVERTSAAAVARLQAVYDCAVRLRAVYHVVMMADSDFLSTLEYDTVFQHLHDSNMTLITPSMCYEMSW